PTVTATEAPPGRRAAMRLDRTASATARGTSSTSGWSNDRRTRAIGGRSTSMRGPPLRDHPPSLVQQLDLDLAQLDGATLGLKADRPLGDLELAVLDELPGVGVLVVELGLLVFDHELAVDEVPDLAVAVDLDLGRDPLVAVVGLRLGVRAMPRDELPIHDDVRAGRADVAGGPLVLVVAAEELDFD